MQHGFSMRKQEWQLFQFIRWDSSLPQTKKKCWQTYFHQWKKSFSRVISVKRPIKNNWILSMQSLGVFSNICQLSRPMSSAQPFVSLKSGMDCLIWKLLKQEVAEKVNWVKNYSIIYFACLLYWLCHSEKGMFKNYVDRTR